MTAPRMRTAAGAVATIKETDPDNAISVHFIRQLIRSGKIPHVACGTKLLIDVDKLLAYLEEVQTV